ncbi:MAG TPA: aminotransferase [Caulobacteraceae bacterium]
MSPTRLAEIDSARLVHGFTNLSRHRQQGPVVITRGEGVRVFDESGRDYIEAAAGMWCAAFGFSEPALIEAAAEQFARLPYYHTLVSKSVDPAVRLAEKLSDIAPIENPRVYFALSGSEANDFLVKFLWYANNARGRPQKKKIISRVNGYHGATVVSTSLTGLPRNHALFDAPLDRFLKVGDYNYYRQHREGEDEAAFAARLADELEAEILRQGPETVAAFLAEPITGGGGVVVPPADYYPRIQQVLKKYDVLFLADEVITGFGRTGQMFGCEALGIRPDAMVVGKAITGAYQPLAAVILSEEIYRGLEAGSDAVGSFGHGATYSGYPVGCAVGLRAIDLIEERGLLAHTREVGAHLMARLQALQGPHVGEVRGRGLMAVVELVADPVSRRPFERPGAFAALVQAKAEARGVIVRPTSPLDAIAFSPPLVISHAEVDEMMDRFEAGLRDATEAFDG